MMLLLKRRRTQLRPPINKKSRPRISQWPNSTRRLVNIGITIGSLLLCFLFLMNRLPGMTLLGITPNWLLIWVVSWSVKRRPFLGAAAGIALGLILDGMTEPFPSHAISLGIVGYLTGCLQKQRYVQEDFISVAFIVFGMSWLAEFIMAVQFSLMGERTLEEIWRSHQLIILSSAILSSLWSPVLYFPLNRWWEINNKFEN